MPHQTPLRSGDPRGIGRYRVAGRMVGIPSEDPIFVGTGPDGSEVAISLLRGDWSHDPAARDRFAAEAAVAKRVPPFCAARVLDAGYDGTDAYLVSEFVAGPSLLEVVARQGVRRSHDLDAIAIGMATGLASVHQAGLVHGSFGPEYVVLSTADGIPRVIEYGITPPYGTATPSADILAWGQTVVFAASGRPPLRAGDLDVLPLSLRALVEQCLDPEPAQRPAARAIVQNMLGQAEIAAGLLAEGARRATRLGASQDDLLPAVRRGNTDQFAAVSRGQAQARSAHSRSAGRPDQARNEAAPRSARVRQTADRTGAGRTGTARTDAGRSPRGLRTGLITGAAVVVLVLAGLLVMHALGGTTAGNAGLSSDTGTTATTPPASATPTAPVPASPGPTLPPTLVGTWSGQVQQPPTDTYTVRVDLHADGTGRIRYTSTGLSCAGTLSTVTLSASKLTMTQAITRGNCENGNVTIELAGSDIRFAFASTGPSATGTLARA